MKIFIELKDTFKIVEFFERIFSNPHNSPQDKEITEKNNRTKSKYPRRRSVNLDNIQQLEHNVTITSISIRKPEENCPKEKVYDYSYDQIMISRSNNDPPLRRIRRNTSVLR